MCAANNMARNILGRPRISMSAPMMLSLSLLMIMMLASNADAYSSYMQLQQQRTPALEVDALRNEYFLLEKSLWEYLSKTANSQNNRQTQIKKVYDSHREFINSPQMSRKFLGEQYKIMHHYEWTLLESNLTHLSSIFDFYKV